jgi:hypothetical protein
MRINGCRQLNAFPLTNGLPKVWPRLVLYSGEHEISGNQHKNREIKNKNEEQPKKLLLEFKVYKSSRGCIFIRPFSIPFYMNSQSKKRVWLDAIHFVWHFAFCICILYEFTEFG